MKDLKKQEMPNGSKARNYMVTAKVEDGFGVKLEGRVGSKSATGLSPSLTFEFIKGYQIH